MNENSERPIALVGLMGAGKTSVARILGQRLRRPVADLDHAIESECGLSVAELFERHGEAEFRRRESAMLAQALAGDAGVVACGGGVVLDPALRALLRERCRTVWLEVEPAVAARRIGAAAASRPLLAADPPERRLEALLEERAALYAEVAAIRVATGTLTPDQVADVVLQRLGQEVT